eukprot:GHVQ01021879.1.p1 GENE.GHVQ01021879.1~~GHVQ01021879.1.p1  ORF type:complete len:283 (+),score=45.51 GHVQ01021879.1:648-1496(+)
MASNTSMLQLTLTCLALILLPLVRHVSAACSFQNVMYPSSPSEPVVGSTHTCFCSNTSWVNCKPNNNNAYSPPPTAHVYPPPPSSPHPVTAIQQRNQFVAADFVFDLFGKAPDSNGMGGTIRAVNVNDLPSLKGQGVSYTLFRLEPCGINLPHIHPRATEIIALTEGNDLVVGFAEENGGGEAVINRLYQGQVTFFPQGLIHYQQNMGCYEAVYLSALNSEDPGVITVATQLFTLPNDTLEATFALDEYEIENIRGMLPAGPAQGRAACMKRCGIVPSAGYD